MKYWIFILFVFVACQKDEVAIPAYFQINEIGFNDNINGEASTSKISDVWFYVNDQKQGIYEMPCTFPVIGDGTNNIKIFSGIKVNGISASRDIYPFYETFDTTLNFISDSILSLLPSTKYKQNLNFYSEDFDGLGNNFDISINSDTNFISPFPTDSVYGQLSKVGKVVLKDPFLNFEATTFEIDDFPSAGSPVYLELDYKNNSTFIVGAYVNFSQSVIKKSIIAINPSEDWNKIYVNLTPTINESIGAQSLKVFISMLRPESMNSAELSIDNFKIIYQ
ncbi:hypothetical protein OA863_05765 [Bacteroidota bacterium]|nr:hypothetical protein [Bacteroidota bacterium]MDC3230374.1 hypothetical protein [Bacteroidota bacterium]